MVALAGFVLLDLALILSAAWALGRAATWAGQPRVIGEILAGIALGPTLLGPASAELFPEAAREVLRVIGLAGLLLYIFLVGLDLDTGVLRRRVRTVAAVGAGAVALPVAAGFAIAPLLDASLFRGPNADALGFSLFIGALLSVTALPVMARILQERSLDSSELGQVGIASAALVTVLMFVVARIPVALATEIPPARLAAEAAAAAAFIAFLVVPVRAALAEMSLARGTFAIAVLSLMSVSGIVAHALGLSVIVGGFLAGLVVAERRRTVRAALPDWIDDVATRVGLPVFLAVSGLATDLRAVSLDAGAGLLLLFVVALASKWGAGVAFGRLCGLSWSAGHALGILLSCRGLLVLVVSLAGLEYGLIGPAMHAGAVVIALATTAMVGPLFSRAGAASGAGGRTSS